MVFCCGMCVLGTDGVVGGGTGKVFYASFLLFLSCRIEEGHTDIRHEHDSSRKGRSDR